MASQNKLYVFAGPNGSGKTTITDQFLDMLNKQNIPYINADIIEKERFADIEDVEQRNRMAAVTATAVRNRLLFENQSFAFETVLSTERNLLLMQEAKKKDYKVICVYCITRDPEINISRVKKRVLEGGHPVPEDKIRTRYQRCLELLPKVIITSDIVLFYDNSIGYELILFKHDKNIDIIVEDLNDEWVVKNICEPLKKLGVEYNLILKPRIPNEKEITNYDKLINIEDYESLLE